MIGYFLVLAASGGFAATLFLKATPARHRPVEVVDTYGELSRRRS